jgi:acetoin utilization protein AcuB
MTSMTVADYMTHYPHFVGPEHSMAAAHRLMRRHKIRHLPVMKESKLVGLVSQRDLYFLESLKDVIPEVVKVAEAMSEEVLAVEPTTPVAQVARQMIDARIGSVIVMKDNRVTGIFTTIDALRALMELTEVSDEILESSQ